MITWNLSTFLLARNASVIYACTEGYLAPLTFQLNFY